MSSPSPAAALLPHPGPNAPADRMLLFAIRRMAIGGLDDAYAAHAMLSFFGRGFRRPLVLLRATMAEIARVSARALVVAPCCCPRTTTDERGLLAAIASGTADEDAGPDRLARFLNIRHCHGAADAARALGQSFADLGRPLALPAG